MALRSLSVWLLVLEAVALRKSCLGASSHSMKYFYSSISEPSQGLPQFVSVGYVDDQVFAHYDSHRRRVEPRVSWMEKVGKEKPQYWDRETQVQRGNEYWFREYLEILRLRYNQSKGLHTWQWMYGCELKADRRKGGFWQYGYDGRTFITYDKETLTWVAPDPQGQITQRKWDAVPGSNQRQNVYLDELCIEWLEMFLSYGKETLLKTEPPEVTVSIRTKEVEDGMETHVCRLHGFYPREINASWRRDGVVWLQDAFHGSVAPNADGTFHYWLSIRIDPQERGRYWCHVEHDGLQEPLDVALEDERLQGESNMGIIIGCIGAVVLLNVIAGIYVFFKRRQDDYKKTPRQDYFKKAPYPKSKVGFIIVCLAAGLLVLLCMTGSLAFFQRPRDDYKKAPRQDDYTKAPCDGSKMGNFLPSPAIWVASSRLVLLESMDSSPKWTVLV